MKEISRVKNQRDKYDQVNEKKAEDSKSTQPFIKGLANVEQNFCESMQDNAIAEVKPIVLLQGSADSVSCNSDLPAVWD